MERSGTEPSCGPKIKEVSSGISTGSGSGMNARGVISTLEHSENIEPQPPSEKLSSAK